MKQPDEASQTSMNHTFVPLPLTPALSTASLAFAAEAMNQTSRQIFGRQIFPSGQRSLKKTKASARKQVTIYATSMHAKKDSGFPTLDTLLRFRLTSGNFTSRLRFRFLSEFGPFPVVDAQLVELSCD